jgi:benzoyl-CoA reductase subunit C
VSVLDRFQDIIKFPHQFARDWKQRTGGRVLGYLCTNLPEELIYAAGVLPVRLLGSNEAEDVTRTCIQQSAFCSFARDCFAQVLEGRYSYLEGVAFAQCCPHAREVFYNCGKYLPVTFNYEVTSPMLLQNPHAKKYLTAEIEDFKHSLEVWTGKNILLAELDRAIEIYNNNRRLMQAIYAMMKADNPPVTEAEAAEISLAGMLIDKAEHNRMLEEALKELPARHFPKRQGPRLMLLGSVNTNIEIIKNIDSMGGRAVIDDYCTGNRYYQSEVIPEENRLAALAGRLIDKPPCPLKDIPERRRITHILKQIDEYQVQGVIYTIQRLCDAHGLDYPSVQAALKEKDIPMLKLELDITVPIAQVRTRIEAFMEMIEGL